MLLLCLADEPHCASRLHADQILCRELRMLQALRNKDPIGVPNGWPAIVAAAYALLANQTELLMCAEVDSKFVS